MAHDYGSPKGQRQLMAKSAVERRDSEAQMPHVRLTDCTSLSLSHVVSFGDGFRCMIVKRTPHLPNESATFVTESSAATWRTTLTASPGQCSDVGNAQWLSDVVSWPK